MEREQGSAQVEGSVGQPTAATEVAAPAGAAASSSLRATLDHCARHVPLYRAIEPPRAGEDDAAALARFPVLGKEQLRRAFPHGLLPAGRTLAQALRDDGISFVGTSGTSGERVQVLWHPPWWEAQERAGYGYHRVARAAVARPDFREAVLTTPVCSGNLCHVGRLPFEERLDGHTLFLNQTLDPAAWSDADVRRIADELDRFAPHHLEADPAYLAHFCARIERMGRRLYQPEFVDLSYEFPSRRHVATIARQLTCPIVDSYGSTECGFVFIECEAGGWHHNAAWSHVEFAALPGLADARLLQVTPLQSRWLNLVRFDSGDLVVPRRAPCACGSETALASIEGRLKDCVVAAAGALVTVRAVDRALADLDGLLHWRLLQREARRFELDLVPDGVGPTPDGARAAAALATLLGVAPAVRVVASVPVAASGKFRLCAAEHVDVESLARGHAARASASHA